MASRLRNPPIIWDNTYEETDTAGLCIKASDDDFQMVASYLFSSVGAAYPDPNISDTRDIKRDIYDFDEPLRNACLSVAMQMFSMLNRCNEGDEDMPVYHRQKPDNPCVLQELQDGVWVDVFDYAACLGPALAALETNEQATKTAGELYSGLKSLWDNFEEKYTGTSGSVNPKLVIDGETAGANRAAICKAVSQTVRGYVSQSINAKNQESDNLSRVALALGFGLAIAVFAGLIISFPVAAALTPAIVASLFSAGNLAIASASIGLSAVSIQVWAQRIKDTELGVFQDEAAIADIVCILYGNLKDQTDISKEKFQEELDVSGESANAQALYNAIRPLFENDVAYAAFLELWLKEINIGGSGLIEPACECQKPTVLLQRNDPWQLAILIYEGKDGDDDVYYGRGYVNAYRLGLTIGVINEGGAILTSIEHLAGPAEDHVEWFDIETGFVQYGHYAIDEIPTDRPLAYIGITKEFYTGAFAYRMKWRLPEE